MTARSKAVAWLAFGAALLVLVSPLKLWWAQPTLGWITPFVLWLVLIVLGAWQNRPRGRDDV